MEIKKYHKQGLGYFCLLTNRLVFGVGWELFNAPIKKKPRIRFDICRRSKTIWALN